MNRFQMVRIAVFVGLVSKLCASVTMNPAIQLWTERETGLQTAGWSAVELSDGRMAFGGHSLLIFDGDTWQSFAIGSAYAIRGLCLGDDEKIWAGATNELGYFEPNADGTFSFQSLKSFLPPNIQEVTVWNIFPIEDKMLFITNTNLLLWDGTKFETWPIDSPHYVKAFSTNQGILIQDRSSGIIRFDKNGPKPIIPPSAYEHSTISFAHATATRLFLFAGGKTWSFSVDTRGDPHFYASAANSVPKSVTHAIETKGTYIAYATNTEGIHILDVADPRRSQILSGKNIRSIMHLFESKDGSLWALGRDHITRVSLHVKMFDESSGIIGGQVSAIGAVNNNLAVSTDEGLFVQVGESFQRVPGIPALRAWSIKSPKDNVLIAGTTSGVWINNGNETFRIRDSIGAFAIEEAFGNEILVSNESSIKRIDITKRTSHLVADRTPDFITSIARIDEYIWAGTATKGVHFTKASSQAGILRRVAPSHGLPDGDYNATVFMVNGSLIVACKEQLFLLSPNKDQFRAVAGFRGTVAHVSNRDASGSVWLSLSSDSSRGLSNRIGKLSIEEGSPAWTPLNLALHEKRGKPFPIYVFNDYLAIGAPAGVAMYKIGNPLNYPKPRIPKLFLEAKPPRALSSKVLEFPFDQSPIRFRYGSLEYGQREALRFQTRLVGADADWSAPTNDSVAQFVGLRDGTYEFFVRSTIDGFASESASIVFRIKPPWWRTGLAFSAYGFGTIAIITAAIRFREQQLQRRTLRLEQLVAGRTAQLQRANEAKTEFVTAMSHDVRTPINGIMGSTIELSRSQLDSNQRVLVRRIEACSNMLCGLVEDVLDFAAIESGQTLVANLAFSPAALLESIKTVLRASVQGSDCLFESEIDPNLPHWLKGDEHRIRQIMVNYGSNAVKYAGADLIKLRVSQDRGFVVFSVLDRGPGIAEHAQNRLFLRFSRIAPDLGQDGKGLGLAGCRAIARLMNGTVGVASKAGKGAEFWLRIPLRESSPGDFLDEPKTEVMYHQRALLVEDIHFSAEASKSVLQSLGFEVVVVDSGNAAIERVSMDRFDIVFLDINLPDRPGTEVAAAILALGGQRSAIKILATTAHSTIDHKAECIKSGMCGFISKPLTPEKVRHALTRADISPDTGEQPPSLVSFAMLDFLSNGSPAELRKHADMLLSGITEELVALSAAASSRDREHIGRTAHRMITHARIAGDQGLIELAARLESTAPHECMDSINDQIIKIHAEVSGFKSRLEDHLHQAGSA